MIVRNIYINSKQVCAPIHIVYGTSNQQIQFVMKDVTLASGNTATFYCLAPNNQRYSAAGTIDTSAGTITFTPAAGFFVTGNNLLQCEITQSSKKLHNFAVDVVCELNVQSAGTASEPVDVASYTARAETAATNAAASEAAAETYLENMAAAFPAIEASGNLITIPDGADGIPVKSMVVNIEPVQAGSGDPSPSNVREISGWNRIFVNRTGQNILNGFQGASNTSMGVTWTWGSGSDDGNLYWNLSASGTTTAANSSTDNKTIGATTLYTIAVAPGETLTFSFRNVTGTLPTIRLFLRTTANSNIAYLDSANGVWTWTNTSDSYKHISKIMVRIPANVGAVSFNGYLQCEVGNTASSDFIPYQGGMYNISFGSAGTVYGGTLDVTTGVLTVTHVINEPTTASSLSWGGVLWYVPTTVPNKVSLGSVLCKCSHAPSVSSNTFYAERSNAGHLCAVGSTRQLRYKNTDIEQTVEAYNTFFAEQKAAGTPVQICYELLEPMTYQLTTPTQITSLLGQNNIWADTGSIELTYRADPALYVERRLKATRNIIAGVEDSMTATKNYTTGQYLICGDNLYKVTANIANGGAITVGTNVTATTVAEQLILALS